MDDASKQTSLVLIDFPLPGSVVLENFAYPFCPSVSQSFDCVNCITPIFVALFMLDSAMP